MPFRRLLQTLLSEDRAALIQAMQAQVDTMPPGPARDDLLKQIEESDVIQKFEAWANSPELQPPR